MIRFCLDFFCESFALGPKAYVVSFRVILLHRSSDLTGRCSNPNFSKKKSAAKCTTYVDKGENLINKLLLLLENDKMNIKKGKV